MINVPIVKKFYSRKLNKSLNLNNNRYFSISEIQPAEKTLNSHDNQAKILKSYFKPASNHMINKSKLIERLCRTTETHTHSISDAKQL